MVSKLWSPREDARLRAAYAKGGLRAARKALPHRTERSIYSRVFSLQIPRPLWKNVFTSDTPWTEKENAYLRRYFPSLGSRAFVEKFGTHSMQATREHARQIGLRRNRLPQNILDVPEIRRLYEIEELGLDSIAERLHSNRERIRMAMIAAGIERRPQQATVQKMVYPRTRAFRKRMRELWATPSYRAKVQRGWHLKPTRLEHDMADILQRHQLPFRYVGDWNYWISNMNPDFIHTAGRRLCIEVGNPYHHDANWPRRRRQDLAKHGWKVVIFRTRRLDENMVVRKIRDLLKGES